MIYHKELCAKYICYWDMLSLKIVSQTDLTRKHSSRMHTARLPTISCCIPFPGVWGGYASPRTYPPRGAMPRGTVPKTYPFPLEGTWYERYPPIPRKDMGPEIPTPNPCGQPDTCEKHYLPATSFAGGKNLTNFGKTVCKIMLIPVHIMLLK